MRRLFALAIFVSATLLFYGAAQPLAGKMMVPVLSGSPAVWSTCMVFCQAVLLLGYLYAHALSTRVAPRWQWSVHVCVLIVASVTLLVPIEIGEPGGAVQNVSATIATPVALTSGISNTSRTPASKVRTRVPLRPCPGCLFLPSSYLYIC
jgi:hypothetical protein